MKISQQNDEKNKFNERTTVYGVVVNAHEHANARMYQISDRTSHSHHQQ